MIVFIFMIFKQVQNHTVIRVFMKSWLVACLFFFGCQLLMSCDSAEIDSQQLHDDVSTEQETTFLQDKNYIDVELISKAIHIDFVSQAYEDEDDEGLGTMEEESEKSQLSSDPTEDPDQESHFYEFPAWNIPAPQ